MPKDLNIIPQPDMLSIGDGEHRIFHDVSITCRGEGALEIGELLADYLRPATGFAIPVAETADSGTIQLVVTGNARQDAAGFVDEQYSISITASTVMVRAENATGLARGIQTLRQVFPPTIMAQTVQDQTWSLPMLEIKDHPQFRWRGQHLDVSRHFFTVDEVCRFIDLLALHRLNVCHLHLTDDQGWRIEIKQYPKLTSVGATRECTLIGHHCIRPRTYDKQPYGGYYTQEDIKAIVSFASRRHITLVPEIDMPGHMAAAICAYPELGNTGHPIEVRCHWGISQHVLNVEETTIAFAKAVLSEVMDLFPGRFIHIGGDEAPKVEWSESRRAQARMAELGLANEDELQSWFIRQLDAHIAAAGRRLIGWDEILEGGLAEGATVMSWRGEEGGIHAAKQGNDVVMATKNFLYFDYYQRPDTETEPLAIGGLLPLDKVYGYTPVPDAIPSDSRHHVLGCQGQLWTEYMATMKSVEYMGFPRICALAEVVWLTPEKKDYANFLNRLHHHRKRLSHMQVNLHPEP